MSFWAFFAKRKANSEYTTTPYSTKHLTSKAIARQHRLIKAPIFRERLHEFENGLFSAPILVPSEINSSVLAMKTGPNFFKLM